MKFSEFIFFQEHQKTDGNCIGEVKLNNPKRFNALNSSMILSLKDKLIEWKENKKIDLIFIHGEGDKAFCAGGDVKSIYHKIKESQAEDKDPGLAVQSFFEEEYKTMYLMHTYPKPIVLWGHGITMGGGLGLFMASSHSIVTESSVLAMPEVSIGLFPDVGGSYFLNLLKKNIGWYLALTGHRMNGTEAHYLNMSKLCFKDSHKEEVFQFLLSSFESRQDFDQKIKQFQNNKQISLDQKNWIQNFEKEIVNLIEKKSLKTIYNKIKEIEIQDVVWLKNKETFLKGSPSSLGVICEQLRRGESLSLKEVFQMELVMVMQHARHPDFSEGVRAVLIDKTGSPAWQPAHIKDIQDSWILEHFCPLPAWVNPLKDL